MTISPEQFNKLATKDDQGKIKNEVAEIKSDVKSLISAVDGLAKNVQDIEHAFVSNQAAHDRFEKRISKIESHLGLNPYSVEYKK
jgi:septal ring factor EnvC (AmiA/AmiB activator)